MQQDTCHLQLSIMAPEKKHEELHSAALAAGRHCRGTGAGHWVTQLSPMS